MNYFQLTILLCILILSLVYVNFQLGNISLKNTENYYPKLSIGRYQSALKENFVVNTNELEAEINKLNVSTSTKNNSTMLNDTVKNMVLDSVANANANANTNTNILSNKFLKEDDTVEEMLEKLDNMESMCSKLDKEQKIKDDLEQISINKSSLQELENQDKRIEELAEIVKHMRIEKEKRDIISNKCRVNKQRNLDSNYAKVEALSKEGFLKDESHKVNVNIPKDGIKFDLSDLTDKINKLRPKTKKQAQPQSQLPKPNRVCNLPKKHGFDLNKLNNGICHKCNPDTLKKDIDLIHKNFGNI